MNIHLRSIYESVTWLLYLKLYHFLGWKPKGCKITINYSMQPTFIQVKISKTKHNRIKYSKVEKNFLHFYPCSFPFSHFAFVWKLSFKSFFSKWPKEEKEGTTFVKNGRIYCHKPLLKGNTKILLREKIS